MKHLVIAATLFLAPFLSHAQYEPFSTLEQSIAYDQPPNNVLESLCADGSIADMMGVPSNAACEQRLWISYVQIAQYAAQEPEIFATCDAIDTVFVHEVWDCMHLQ